ncbi:MAG: acetate--CoA ligase family protein [Parasphingorhabdus sp.]|nr:acetate--CoA ligase family protein [Parasphingorhabdus sp.]
MMADTPLHPLAHLVAPRSIALVGASERPGSIGEQTLTNLTKHSDFAGPLYLVHPKQTEMRGMQAWPSVADLPEAPDVALIVVPAAQVPRVVEDCAARGVRFAMILSSGFGEAGEEGAAAQDALVARARAAGMRIYGPNCPGLVNINLRLGLTFSPAYPEDLTSGPIGLATQGGGLGRNVLQAMERGIGVGLWASTGNEADLQVADFIDYMVDAPDIRVIVTMLEGVSDGPRLMAALARAAKAKKPVVALKIGKSDYGRKAAQSHTASLTGSAEVNSAVFREFGVIEVDDIDELADIAWLLARATPDARDGLAIYCGSGGTAALAADIVGTSGLRLSTFSEDTLASLGNDLPSYAAIENPVDTTTAVLADDSLTERTLQAVARDPDVAMVLVPNALEYGRASALQARAIAEVQEKVDIPILPIWMSDRLGEGYRHLVDTGFAPPRSLGKAIAATRRWVEYGKWRTAAGDLPATNHIAPADHAPRALSEVEGKSRLNAAGIRTLQSALAGSREEAIAVAERIGFPVVAKVASEHIAHKTEADGVHVGLADADAVGTAWDRIVAGAGRMHPEVQIDGALIEEMAPSGGIELMVGVTRDPVFGHILTFGLGGVHVEILRDVTRRLLPLDRPRAEAMMREIRGFALLDGARGRPRADVDAVIELLLALSRFVEAHADTIEEIDLNPVWVGPQGSGAVPLDALIVAREPRS